MTLLTAPGLYVGWDEVSMPFTITRTATAHCKGVSSTHIKLEWHRLVIGIQAPAIR